jgi:hypothetical protein
MREPMEQEWISTGKAAAMLGYSRRHFVEKFDGIIQFRRVAGGHRRWWAPAVQKLITLSDEMAKAV